MKKIIKGVFFNFLIIVPFILITRVQALSVDNNNITIDNGKSANILLYANTNQDVSKVDFTLVFSSYDIEADFIVNDKYNDSISGTMHSITFDEAKSGKILLGTVSISVKSDPSELSGIVNIHSASARDNDDNVVNLNNQVINVSVNMITITTSTTTTSTTTTKTMTTSSIKTVSLSEGMLLRIDSDLTKIELEEDVFEYTAVVASDVTELDLVPVLRDETSKVAITSQKISELDDNKIVITVSNGLQKEEYVINVKIKKKEERTKIAIDNSEFVADNGYKKKWLLALFGFVIVFATSLLFIKKK